MSFYCANFQLTEWIPSPPFSPANDHSTSRSDARPIASEQDQEIRVSREGAHERPEPRPAVLLGPCGVPPRGLGELPLHDPPRRRLRLREHPSARGARWAHTQRISYIRRIQQHMQRIQQHTYSAYNEYNSYNGSRRITCTHIPWTIRAGRSIHFWWVW